HQPRALHVRVDDVVPILLAHLLGQCVPDDARVVDQHVDPPESLDRRDGRTFAIRCEPDIARYPDGLPARVDDRGGHVPGPGQVHAANGSTLSSESMGYRLAHPATRAGDHGDLALKTAQP